MLYSTQANLYYIGIDTTLPFAKLFFPLHGLSFLILKRAVILHSALWYKKPTIQQCCSRGYHCAKPTDRKVKKISYPRAV